MARKSKKVTRAAAEIDDKFSVSSYTLNRIDSTGATFPGNIAPEGYFYAPFHEVKLKELDDELSYANVRRINYDPTTATITNKTVDYYNSETGAFISGSSESAKTIYILTITMPIPYKFIMGQPFVIYDVLEDMTYRGIINEFSVDPNQLIISTDSTLDDAQLNEGRYIVSALLENAPIYAEYIPSTERLVWRGAKKMSDLSSDSPLYNMPFTNGRLYIHQNVNMFVRRQDPTGDYHLFRPSTKNPLNRFQIEGEPKLDFDYIDYIIDSMVDAC